MKIVSFPEQTAILAENQPDYYLPMPVHRHFNDAQGRITCCWRLSLRERVKLLFTGHIWHQVLTFYEPLQPQLLLLDKPEMYIPTVKDIL